MVASDRSTDAAGAMGGLLALFGDVLLSQQLTQPGILVVHVPSFSGLSIAA
jgi:hypothetical protein